MSYDEIYKRWDDLKDCRLRIGGDGDGGESLWGKKIESSGHIGINNSPLNRKYRWQDIVDPKSGGRDQPKIVHRRWKAKVWFEYTPDKNDLRDVVAHRKPLFDAAESVGHISFFMPGAGFVLLEEEKDAVKKVWRAFKGLNFVHSVELEK